VCPAGTSLGKLQKASKETKGSLELGGITSENFAAAKEGVIEAIRQSFFDKHDVWPMEVRLEGVSEQRRWLTADRFRIEYAVVMPVDLSSPVPNNTTNITSASPTALQTSSINASMVSRLVIAAVSTSDVAQALNISAASLTVISIGKPTQSEGTANCPAGKYSEDASAQCTRCSPGKIFRSW